MHKIRFKDLEYFREKVVLLKTQYDNLSEIEKLNSNIGNKLNKAIREFKRVKGKYFYGNN